MSPTLNLVHGEDEGGVRRRAAELADEVGDVGEGRWWRSGGPGPCPVFIRDTGDSLPCLDDVRPSLLASLLIHSPVLCCLSPFLTPFPCLSCFLLGNGAVRGCVSRPPLMAPPTLVPLAVATVMTRLLAL